MFDKLLRAIAPGIAASRAEAGLRLARVERAQQVLMTYDAARQGGRHAGWRRTSTSAVAEIGGAISSLRAGARELVRNNPHANRVLRVLEAQIAGKGTKPRCQGDDEVARAAAKAAWDRFVETCDADGRTDWYGQQRLMVRTVVEGGEALRVWSIARDGRDTILQCRILEGDHLDHLKNEERADGSRIVQGVEFDAAGRRVAYWLHDRHPGDRFALSSRLATRRVDAGFVDHIFETLRPGQVRGVSWFAPVALVLRDLGELAEAELVRKKVEACIAMIVTNTQRGDGDDVPAIAGATDEAAAGGLVRNAAGQIVERLSPGMILSASEGWGAEFMAPSASEGLVDHMKERLHAVAAGAGVTYHQLSGDLSGANYSSMRAGLIDFYSLLDSWQDELIIQQSARPAWRRVMQAAQMSGALADAPPVAWQRPVRPWVDPLKDMQARELELRLGLQSHQNIIEDLGRDPEEIVRERGEWAALMGSGNVEAGGTVLPQDDEVQGGAAPPEGIGGVDPEIYGRAVRAGAITPQREDEDFFRTAIGLPAAGASVDAAWKADGGFRSPVTIKSKGEAGAAARAADDGADS